MFYHKPCSRMQMAKTTDCWSVVKSPFEWNIATAIMKSKTSWEQMDAALCSNPNYPKVMINAGDDVFGTRYACAC